MAEIISILYVDDEDTLRMLVKDQLSSQGYDIDTADDGDTGLEKIEQRKFDVILLDIRMPRMSGIEVLKELRKRKSKSRVIVLTAVDDLSVAIEAVKNGANDYLTKPYDFKGLVNAIQRVMAK